MTGRLDTAMAEPMKQILFRFVGWVAARHVLHYQAVMVAAGRAGATALRLIDAERLGYYEQTQQQGDDLQELKVLGAAVEIKESALAQGGWEDHHAIALGMIGNVLMQQHDWNPEEVDEWVTTLTDEHFSFTLSDDDGELD